MNLTIVSGCPAGGACGVWGYSIALTDALGEKGIDASLVNASDWSIGGFMSLVKKLRCSDNSILFQYPTAAAHRKVLPILLPLASWRNPVVSVIHEFSQGRLPSRIAIGLIASASRHVVFTNVKEAGAACRMFPWLKSKSSIIPVASAIGRGADAPRQWDVVHFGIIRPGKQIEDFIETVSRIRDLNPSALIVGAVPQQHSDFAENLKERADKINIHCSFNSNDEDVANFLSKSRIALIPFSDGMSSRRTSALSAMLNGTLLITTVAREEASLFKDKSLMASNIDELVTMTRSALLYPDQYDHITAQGEAYAKALSWPSIATLFIKVLSN